MSDEPKSMTVKIGDHAFETPIIKKEDLPPSRKSSRDLALMAEKMNVNPFEILLNVAAGNYAALGYESGVITLDHRISAAKEAASYLYAKKKSIEVHGDSDADPINVTYDGSILDLIKLARGS